MIALSSWISACSSICYHATIDQAIRQENRSFSRLLIELPMISRLKSSRMISQELPAVLGHDFGAVVCPNIVSFFFGSDMAARNFYNPASRLPPGWMKTDIAGKNIFSNPLFVVWLARYKRSADYKVFSFVIEERVATSQSILHYVQGPCDMITLVVIEHYDVFIVVRIRLWICPIE